MAILAPLGSASAAGQDDFSWIRGANYVPSYAATDVEIWLNYDHQTIDRELGYAESIGLSAVRVFLQSLVYHHEPEEFLRRFEDFVSTADAHGLKVMPVLFNSCFGVAPSLESRHMWVANPGPDRLAKEFWPESDAYLQAVVSRYVDDERIALWDVMNEPTATPQAATQEGREQLLAFVTHYCRLVRKLDPSHAITVGVATADNAAVLDLVDVLSCHSYLPGVEAFRESLAVTRDQARAAGKPWIVTECGNPAQGNHYEMAMPVVREFGVGFFVWELMIGRTQFNHQQGLFYADGTVRRIAQVEAVSDVRADLLVEKPDSEGLPFRRALPERIAEYLEFVTRNPVSEPTWRERNTMVEAMTAFQGMYREKRGDALGRLLEARKDYDEGRKDKAFAAVGQLLREARSQLTAAGRPAEPKPLAQKAFVYRDVFGVPHIYGDTEPAAAYALAVVQCEDNARQVFHNLRVAVGRTAEVRGEAAVEGDRTVLLWRLPQIMEEAWQRSPARTKRYLRAFCDGLNDYRRQHPDECKQALPARPQAVMALMKYIGHLPSTAIVKIDVNASLGQASKPSEHPDQSSAFALGPSRTASGRPILLIDPHWPADGVFSFYEFHLHAGRIQVGGFTVPGLPFAAVGYTDGVAWTGTAGGADSADAFELEIHPDHPSQYRYDGRWREMAVREELLPVKTAEGIEQRRLVFRETVHGPVVREENGRAFAGAVCGWEDTAIVEQWLAINRAKTRDELLDAMRMDQATWINFVYATRDGHIGYVQTGSCPLRGEGHRPAGAQDGTSSRANWQDRIAFDDLPQLHDPDTGWLQNCNTAAHMVTAGMSMSPDDFPPGVLYGHLPTGGQLWRGRMVRCYEVLPTLGKATLVDAEKLALDTYAPAARIWVPPLVAAYDARAGGLSDPGLDLKMAVDALRAWDYRVTKESAAATIFRFWRSEYRRLHPESFGNRQASAYPKTPQEQADAVAALRAARDYLKKHHKKVLVPWGEVMRLRRGSVDLPLDGDALPETETMRSTGNSVLTDEGRSIFSGGQVVTTVVELTDPIRARSIVPYGQSREPASPHYTDQMRLYSAGRLRPAWHTWAELRNVVESVDVVEYSPKVQ
jgi:acyl-homoserine-lactone acylase